jgi:hypothetical protein
MSRLYWNRGNAGKLGRVAVKKWGDTHPTPLFLQKELRTY